MGRKIHPGVLKKTGLTSPKQQGQPMMFREANVGMLTAMFFFLNFLAATQVRAGFHIPCLNDLVF